MVVNGDAFWLDERGAVESIASKLAPTGVSVSSRDHAVGKLGANTP
jgi:hypothetical protein